FLNIGRLTGDGKRIIYYACKDFRKPSKLMFDLPKDASNAVKVSHQIYKDKYWRTFERFIVY
ncbi:MAG: DUF695 domain-containing protein, partial [Bacteroidota bacterium]